MLVHNTRETVRRIAAAVDDVGVDNYKGGFRRATAVADVDVLWRAFLPACLRVTCQRDVAHDVDLTEESDKLCAEVAEVEDIPPQNRAAFPPTLWSPCRWRPPHFHQKVEALTLSTMVATD